MCGFESRYGYHFVMKPVNPEYESTLILNSHYQAMGFLTARAVIRHLINGSVKGFDSQGGCYGWNPEVSGSPCWAQGNVEIEEDQPCLRSGLRPYAIPTIVILQRSFGLRAKSKGAISIGKLHSHYKGTCQYCLKKIPIGAATMDHWYPKASGGSNHDFNLILACRPCNTKKADIFPFFNVNGEPVKPKPIVPTVHRITSLPDGRQCREEWKPYLFLS
jgi:hypothetical protein